MHGWSSHHIFVTTQPIVALRWRPNQVVVNGKRNIFARLGIGVASGLTVLVVVLLYLNLSGGEKQIDERIDRQYATAEPQFRRSLDALLGTPFLPGNRVQVLVNGDQIFEPMLAAIRSAKSTISFETYIYWSGNIGQQFVEALSERARAGVKVHVLLDWLGSVKMDESLLSHMRQAGVVIERYHAPRWYQLARFNNRTHRKLLVVDGIVGFTGGVGIADQWTGNAQDSDHWRDTHFQVEGPVVAQMQAVFMDNWLKVSGEVLHGSDYFPALQSRGEHSAQVFGSSPTGGSESMHLMYLLAITSAQHSILLSSAYFVPDQLTVDALVAAAKRGVKIEIITPGELIDAAVVRRASRARWGELLEVGVHIAEYHPTMYHVKVLVVDELLSSVGSTNFDSRSFRLNDEANLNVLDAGFANQQAKIFNEDLSHSKPVSLETWKERPWGEKLLEQLASLLSKQL